MQIIWYAVNVEFMYYSILDDVMPVGCGAPYDKEHENNDTDSIACILIL